MAVGTTSLKTVCSSSACLLSCLFWYFSELFTHSILSDYNYQRLSSTWRPSFGCLPYGNFFSSTFHLSVLGFITKLLVSFKKILLPMPISWSVLLQQVESFRSYTKVFDLPRIYFRQDKKNRVPILFFWICPVSSTLCWRSYLSSMCVFGILVKNHMVQCVILMLSSLPFCWSACISHGSTMLLHYRGPALGLTRHGDITSIVHFILDWFGYSGSSVFPCGFYS